MNKPIRYLTSSLLLALITLASTPVYADPPPWAPAHGWRKQYDPNYAGYTGYAGRQWEDDYGISTGHCNREAVGAVLGGVVGGAVGTAIGNGDGRVVAIIIGTVLGYFIGHKIGQDLDDADRGCLGHALELGTQRHPVRWFNPDNGLNYTVTPLDGFSAGGKKCRYYTLNIRGEDVNDSKQESACLVSDGKWKQYKG